MVSNRKWNEKIDIIVPAYNEEDNIILLKNSLISQIEKDCIPFKLIIIDDGSKDSTYSRAKELSIKDDRIKVIKHQKNRGLGAALRTGFSHATNKYVVTIDSDLSYHPRQIKRFLPLLLNYHAVFGSPYKKRGNVKGVSPIRLVPSIGVSLCYSIACGRYISCWTGMFRSYHTRVAKKIEFNSDGFDSIAEIAVWLVQHNYKIAEVPAVLGSRKYGVSKMTMTKEVFHHLNQLSKIIKR